MMKNKVHWSFWLIALLGLLWNIGGIFNFMMQMKPGFVASMPEIYQAIINGRPTWATGGFAVGAFGGTIGSLFLLLKKPLAGFVFLISLIGIFIAMVHTLNVLVMGGQLSVSLIFEMILLPILVANFLIGFTFYAIKRDWLVS